MRRFAMASGIGLACLSLLACTSLLGDFSVGGASATSPDGAVGDTDGAVAVDGSTAADAGTDAALPALTCKPSTAPARLDTSGNGINYLPPIRAFRSGNQTRVIAQKKGTQGFTVVTFSSGGGTQVNTVPALGGTFPGTVYDVQPIPGGIGVLVLEPIATTSQYRFSLFKVLDNGGGAAPDILTAGMTGNVSGATFAAFGQDDFYIAATVEAGNGNAEVRAARRKPGGQPVGMVTVASGPNGGDTRIKNIVHVGTNAVLFNDRGPEQGRVGAAGYYRVADEPSPGSTGLTPLTPPGGKPLAMFAAGSAPAGVRLALGEVDFQAGTARMLAGTLGPIEIANADVGKLNAAFQLTSFFDAPVQGGDARWIQNDFVAVGSSLGGGGLNLFWYDGDNAAMRVALVGAQKLVPDRTPAFSTLAPRSLVGGLADFDVVWTEAPANDQSPGVLWTQEIVCARAN